VDLRQAPRSDEVAQATPTPEARTPRKRSVRPEPVVGAAYEARYEPHMTVVLNETHERRTIRARADGHCYVDEPDPAAQLDDGGVRPTRVVLVDCHGAMLRPAWDGCLDGDIVMREDTRECLCQRRGRGDTKASCP
jgi:hypothetical protein